MKEERNVALDGIRGIAILLAVVYHVWQDVPAATALDRMAVGTTAFFWTGVDLFFVLSGFLITRILYRTRDSSGYFPSFYARRVLRTWPLYYFALLLLGLPALAGGRLVAASPWWFVLHGANYLTVFHGYPRRIAVHLWSLAIEEQFYLVWPLIRFLRNRDRMMALCMGLIAGAPLLRFALVASGAVPRQIYALTFTRVDALSAGALLALWLATPGDAGRRKQFLTRLTLTCGAVLIAGLARDGGSIRNWGVLSQTLNYTATAGLCACLIGWSMLSDISSLNTALRWRLLPFLGKYSYSIYMFHIWFDAAGRALGVHPAGNAALRVGGSTPAMTAYAALLLAIACAWAWVTWNLLEKRCLALKERFSAGERVSPEAFAVAPR